jgi:hypothetical protein
MPRRLHMKQCLLVGLALSIAAASACSTGGGSPDTSQSGSSTEPTASHGPVSRTLGPAPKSCPGPKPKRERVSTQLAPLAGRDPVWAGFYARLDERTGALHLARDTPRTSNGWRVKVLWAVAEHERAVIALRGRDLTSRARVRFGVGSAAVSTVGLLDPRKPGTPAFAGEPREYPSYLYFPEAGCYRLRATWPGGHWRMVLGVGR